MIEVVTGIRAVLETQRAERHAAWGQPAHPALTTQKKRARHPVRRSADPDDSNEITATSALFKRHVASQGVSASLKRLSELGFLTQAGRAAAANASSRIADRLAWFGQGQRARIPAMVGKSAGRATERRSAPF